MATSVEQARLIKRRRVIYLAHCDGASFEQIAKAGGVLLAQVLKDWNVAQEEQVRIDAWTRNATAPAKKEASAAAAARSQSGGPDERRPGKHHGARSAGNE